MSATTPIVTRVFPIFCLRVNQMKKSPPTRAVRHRDSGYTASVAIFFNTKSNFHYIQVRGFAPIPVVSFGCRNSETFNYLITLCISFCVGPLRFIPYRTIHIIGVTKYDTQDLFGYIPGIVVCNHLKLPVRKGMLRGYDID